MRFAEHFTGIGGFHRGFTAAGMTSTFAGELVAHRRTLLRQHFPDIPTIGGDIADTDARDLGRPDPAMAEWLGRRLVAVSNALPFIAPAISR